MALILEAKKKTAIITDVLTCDVQFYGVRNTTISYVVALNRISLLVNGQSERLLYVDISLPGVGFTMPIEMVFLVIAIPI